MSLKNGGYIYTRVSSKQQSKYLEGHTSLEVQRQECQKYCDTNDIKCTCYIICNMSFDSGKKSLDIMSSRLLWIVDLTYFSTQFICPYVYFESLAQFFKSASILVFSNISTKCDVF